LRQLQLQYQDEIHTLKESLTKYQLKELQHETETVSSKLALNERYDGKSRRLNKTVADLELSLMEEKEHGHHLATQMKILQDKLTTAMLELASYRSLDIYNISYQRELEKMRKSDFRTGSSIAY
jgi:hypothetical protein